MLVRYELILNILPPPAEGWAGGRAGETPFVMTMGYGRWSFAMKWQAGASVIHAKHVGEYVDRLLRSDMETIWNILPPPTDWKWGARPPNGSVERFP